MRDPETEWTWVACAVKGLKLVLPLFFFFWVTGELSTLRQMMKVPNEPGLSPNNDQENAFLSDQSMAGAATLATSTSHLPR